MTIVQTFVIILTILFSKSLSAAYASSEENSSVELTVGIPTDRCPVFYTDQDTNEIIGIGADLMQIAAKEAGYHVTFKPIEEESLKEALDNSTYDVILPFGSAVSSASGASTIVSENLFQTPFTLVTCSDRQLPPLSDLRIGMLHSLAGGAETVRQLYPGVEITLYERMDESVKTLRSGTVDAKEAASAVREWAFLHTSFQILYSYMKASNIPSAKTAESIGMHLVDSYADYEGEKHLVYAVKRGAGNA